MVERFKVKLDSWMSKLLFMGGKIALIRLLLNSLPIFCVSSFQMPKGIQNKLDTI